jgi:hypothetical protein
MNMLPQLISMKIIRRKRHDKKSAREFKMHKGIEQCYQVEMHEKKIKIVR